MRYWIYYFSSFQSQTFSENRKTKFISLTYTKGVKSTRISSKLLKSSLEGAVSVGFWAIQAISALFPDMPVLHYI